MPPRSAYDLPSAIEHQIQTLAELGPSRFPTHAEALAKIAADHGSAFDRLGACYNELGRVPLQRAITFASEEGQNKLETWDAQNDFHCGQGSAAKAFNAEGWLDRPNPELLRKLPCPAVLFGGRKSEVIGKDALEASAKAWKVPLIWFEHSGHFPNLEEPERFAAEVKRFAQASTP